MSVVVGIASDMGHCGEADCPRNDKRKECQTKDNYGDSDSASQMTGMSAEHGMTRRGRRPSYLWDLAVVKRLLISSQLTTFHQAAR
jgi:hypothetical protein